MKMDTTASPWRYDLQPPKRSGQITRDGLLLFE
jgi:hypothetical protein